MLEGRTRTLMDCFETEGFCCLAAGIEDSNRVANEFWLNLALAMMPPAILKCDCGTMVAIILCLLLAREFQKDRDVRSKTQ